MKFSKDVLFLLEFLPSPFLPECFLNAAKLSWLEICNELIFNADNF